MELLFSYLTFVDKFLFVKVIFILLCISLIELLVALFCMLVFQAFANEKLLKHINSIMIYSELIFSILLLINFIVDIFVTIFYFS